MSNDFTGFGLPPKLLQSLERMQFTTPTPIQEKSIPLALAGRDILGSAQTGTGKTGAFGIPLIAKLMEDYEACALVLTPTRELAKQVMENLRQMMPPPHIKTALLIGGEPMPKQFRQLQGRPRLIVGTPGRINDHLLRGSVHLGKVRFLVLDETDRMLDMGFGIQIDKILEHVPQQRQTMLFSATLPQGIVKLSGKYLNNPERVSVGSTVAAAPNIRQELIQITDGEKGDELLRVLAETNGSTIIFVKTKFGTEKLANRLIKQNFRANSIHGDLRQSRRDSVIQGFRDKRFQVLVATDIAARGLDVPHIETVINYDLPQCPEDFIHRIGRTARAGSSGQAISFITPADRAKWNAIHRLMNPKEPSIFGAEKPKQNRGKTHPGKSWGANSGKGPKRANPPKAARPRKTAVWHD
jgi:superfamily II DNA/RNA helicase